MGKDNPVKRVARSNEAKGIVRFLDERERERLLKACTDGPSFPYPAVMVALCTAMRQGEILGLRWRDRGGATSIWMLVVSYSTTPRTENVEASFSPSRPSRNCGS